jgi:hypothetical protein
MSKLNGAQKRGRPVSSSRAYFDMASDGPTCTLCGKILSRSSTGNHFRRHLLFCTLAYPSKENDEIRERMMLEEELGTKKRKTMFKEERTNGSGADGCSFSPMKHKRVVEWVLGQQPRMAPTWHMSSQLHSISAGMTLFCAEGGIPLEDLDKESLRKSLKELNEQRDETILDVGTLRFKILPAMFQATRERIAGDFNTVGPEKTVLVVDGWRSENGQHVVGLYFFQKNAKLWDVAWIGIRNQSSEDEMVHALSDVMCNGMEEMSHLTGSRCVAVYTRGTRIMRKAREMCETRIQSPFLNVSCFKHGLPSAMCGYCLDR